MSFWAKLSSFFTGKTVEKTEQVAAFEKAIKESKEAVESVEIVEPARARTEQGRFIADDKSTEDVNEAWVGGVAPKKKKKPKVVKKKSR
jgi:hypothetical protein|tara:strand:- start:394 stop:660 length:267 start_codon:yes stop_codon:yes gene_type:complete